MTSPELDRSAILRESAAAGRHLARICFKTGPPTHTGVELEWTVHDAADPARPVDPTRLRAALGRHSPVTLDPTSPSEPLRHGGMVTLEPGGQLEISTPPRASTAALIRATEADIAQVTDLLATAGLILGRSGIDPHRRPRPVLETPRYRAMRGAFDRRGPAGRTMMYSTAGLQVCLDAGEPDQVADRWAAAHAVGPPLLAAFASAARHAGRRTGWASARMATWLAIDPARTRPVWTPGHADEDPTAAWIRYVLAAPLLCRRRRRLGLDRAGRCDLRRLARRRAAGTDPPPMTSTTTSAPSFRRCGRAVTWSCATWTPNPTGTGGSRWRC